MGETGWHGDCWRRATAETLDLLEDDRTKARPVVRRVLNKLPGKLWDSHGMPATDGRGSVSAAVILK